MSGLAIESKKRGAKGKEGVDPFYSRGQRKLGQGDGGLDGERITMTPGEERITYEAVVSGLQVPRERSNSREEGKKGQAKNQQPGRKEA